MEINQRIFYLLEKQGKTASDLAKHLGIKPSSLTGWKVEGSYPSSKHIYGISEFLKVSLDYLITGQDPAPSELTPEQKEWLSLLDKLDPIKQAEFKGEIKGYLKAKSEV